MRKKLAVNDEENRQREGVKWQLECGDILTHIVDVIHIDFDAESAEKMVNNYHAAVGRQIERIRLDVERRCAMINEEERRRMETQFHQQQQQPRIP